MRAAWPGRRVPRCARGARGLTRTPPPPPTTPACPDRSPREAAGAASKPRRSAMVRSPRHPKISPAFPALFEEGFDSRCSRLGARRRLAEQCRRQSGSAPQYKAVTHEPQESSVIVSFSASRCRLEARDGAAIDDQHGGAALQTVDQCAEVVFGFSNASLFHMTRLARIRLFKQHRASSVARSIPARSRIG